MRYEHFERFAQCCGFLRSCLRNYQKDVLQRTSFFRVIKGQRILGSIEITLGFVFLQSSDLPFSYFLQDLPSLSIIS